MIHKYTREETYEIIKKAVKLNAPTTETKAYVMQDWVGDRYITTYIINVDNYKQRKYIINEVLKPDICNAFYNMFTNKTDNYDDYVNDLMEAFYYNNGVNYLVDLINCAQYMLELDIASGRVLYTDLSSVNELITIYEKLVVRLKNLKPHNRTRDLRRILTKFLKYTNKTNFDKHRLVESFYTFTLLEPLSDNLLKMFGYRLVDILLNDGKHIVGIYKEHNFNYRKDAEEEFEQECRKKWQDFYNFCN